MKERTLTAVGLLSTMLALVIFSAHIVYPIGMAILAVVAVFEMLRVMGAHKNMAISIPAYLISAAFPIGAYFVEEQSVLYLVLALAASIFVYLIWLMGVSVFSKGKVNFSGISEVFVSTLYVSVAFTSLSLLRYIDRSCGVFEVVLVFVISWICDAFAFAVGSMMGKHKLIPEISPKKTVEGAVGGVVFSVIFSLLYGFGLDLIVERIEVNYLILGLCGAVLAVVSQLGDLVASLLKREYGAKDYGRIFPGHGGVMDRFDSVIAVATILMIVCLISPPFYLS